MLRFALATLILGAVAAVLFVWFRPPTTASFTDGGPATPAQRGKTYRWNFDDAPLGEPPSDFAVALGAWKVEAEESAPSRTHVLRQVGRFANPDFPRILVKPLTFADLTLRVHCRPEAGWLDRACGLMFRLQDSDNYLLTRANALEDNIRVYHVVKGDRQQIASASRSIKSGQWHTLEVAAHGPQITVKWDDDVVLSVSDRTFAAGKIGLWTKSNSVTAFDDLEVTAE